MTIFHSQLRYLIGLTLTALNPALSKQNAVELLMLTAAQESHCGRWLWQDDGDPEIEKYLAYGIFQMEQPAYIDAANYLLRRYPHRPIPPRKEIIWNLKEAIVLARCYYAARPFKIPPFNEIYQLACYYKLHWNTPAGKATIKDAIDNYFKYANPE